MSRLYDQLADEIFDTLKGYGKILSLFDKDGNRVFAPTNARRVFCQPDKMMISLDENGDDSQVKMYLSQSTDIKDMQSLISTLRNISTRYNVLFNVRKFGKELAPRDFAYQSLPESIAEGLWGTTKTSYQKIGNSKLVIRHSASVDESVKGSRTRKIKSVFIENTRGERFYSPPNLKVARALAQHINMGGTPYDEFGNIISGYFNEMVNLNKGLKSLKKSNTRSIKFMESAIHSRLSNIKTDLVNIAKIRKYQNIKESMLQDTSLINEDMDQVQSVSNSLTDCFQDSTNTLDFIPYITRAILSSSTINQIITLVDNTTKQDLLNTLTSEFGFTAGVDFISSVANPLLITMTEEAAGEAIPYLNEFHPNEYKSEEKMPNIKLKPDTMSQAIKSLNNIGRFDQGKDFTVSAFGNSIFVTDPANFREIKDILTKTGVIMGSPERKTGGTMNYISAKKSSPAVPRGIVKKGGVWESTGKTKIEQWCEKWIDANMPSSSSALNTSGDQSQIENRSKDLARGISAFMTGNISVHPKKVDDSRFRSEKDAYNYKVGEVAELHFGNDMFSNFLATVYDKLMHGLKLSGPEKQVADKAAEYATIAAEPVAAESAMHTEDMDEQSTAIVEFNPDATDEEKAYRMEYFEARVYNSTSSFTNVSWKNDENTAIITIGDNSDPEQTMEDLEYLKHDFKDITDISMDSSETIEENTSNEDILRISFPTDGDDTIANVLIAFLDKMNVLSNEIEDGNRVMTFDADNQDIDTIKEKISGLLAGIGVDADISTESTQETEINEFAGDERDWSHGGIEVGSMVSTPLGAGHVVDISGDAVKVEMMSGKIEKLHIDDVNSVSESISKEIDEWFEQFNPDKILGEFRIEDANKPMITITTSSSQSVNAINRVLRNKFGATVVGTDYKNINGEKKIVIRAQADSADISAIEQTLAGMPEVDNVESDIKEGIKYGSGDDVSMEDAMKAAVKIRDACRSFSDDEQYSDFISAIDKHYGAAIADAIDSGYSGDKLHYQSALEPELVDLINNTDSIIQYGMDSLNLEEAFSDDPVGDAEEYYQQAYDRGDKLASVISQAVDNFSIDDFIKTMGSDLGMDSIGPNADPEDITVTDGEVFSSLEWYIANQAEMLSGSDDIRVDTPDVYDEVKDMFPKIKQELINKGLLFSQTEGAIPGNVQTDFRKDVSGDHNQELARIRKLAGMK